LAVAREIADALPAPGATEEGGPGVAGGDAGLALFHAWLARSTGGEDASGPYLDAAAEALAEVPLGTGLYSGFSGVAWAAELLQGSAGEAGDGEDMNEEIDEALLTHVSLSPWTTHYDLVSGPVGIAVYALERLPRRSGAAVLEQVVARLEETAVPMPDGVAWHTTWSLLPEHQRPAYPTGHYNLGVAHGVPGAIAVLAQAVAAGVAPERARVLLDGAVAWLLARELPPEAPSRFGYSDAPGLEPAPSRAAWCYGDPGIAAALLLAGRCADEEAWEREALRIARIAARRPVDAAGVVDAGVCHGAAGLALIYDRIFQATGDEELRDAALLWTRRTLEMREPGKGVAGYQSWGPTREGPSAWLDDPGLLTGAAGVALTLLAAATPVEPAWDRFLLVSSRFA
ncbi:MAG TPA: lanthionine synthetase C family protein, partial [Longimicrobiaceae bacterium]